MLRNTHSPNLFLCPVSIDDVTEQVTTGAAKIFRFSRLGEYLANRGIGTDPIQMVEVSRKWRSWVRDVPRKLMQYMALGCAHSNGEGHNALALAAAAAWCSTLALVRSTTWRSVPMVPSGQCGIQP